MTEKLKRFKGEDKHTFYHVIPRDKYEASYSTIDGSYVDVADIDSFVRPHSGCNRGCYASYIKRYRPKRKVYRIDKFAKVKGISYSYIYEGIKKPTIFDIIKNRDELPF